MGALFSKKKKVISRVTEQDKAVLQLKMQRDKLKQYQKRLASDMDREREMAKQLIKDGKVDKAKLLLRKKRYLEGMITKLDNQLFNIETMTHDVEFAQIEIKVLDGLKSGNEALKDLHKVLTIENVEKIMDDTMEGIEKQREIDELLSGGVDYEEDEAQLSEELDQLMASTENIAEDEELNLPDVPTTDLPKKTATKVTEVKKVQLAA